MTSWLNRLIPQAALADRRAAAFDTAHLRTGIGLRTANSAMVTLVASATIFGLQIAQLAILSRLLSPEDFGLVGMAVVATGFVKLFADVGLSAATVQREEVDQAFVSALFYIDLLVSCGLMLLCFAMAPLSANIFSEPRVSMIVAVIGITFPLVALRGQHIALLSRRMLLVRINLVAVLANAAGAVAAIMSAWWLELGYWSIVVGIVFSDVSQVLLSWIVSPWVPSRPGSLVAGKSALGFGLNLLGANLAGWLWKQADRALIGWRWDPTELGYYTRAYSVLMVPINLVSGPLGSAVIPALSRLQGSREEWTALMLTAARILAFFAGLLTLGLSLNAEFIIGLMLGPNWDLSVTIFSLLALSLFPSFVWEHARFVFISLGRTDTMRRYAVVAAIVHVAAFGIGVAWGGTGVAVALAAASALVTPMLLIVAARIARVTVGHLVAQFAPSFGAMLVVWALMGLAEPYFVEDISIAQALAKSGLITLTFVLAHLAILPFHTGWREDVQRATSVASKLLTRKRTI